MYIYIYTYTYIYKIILACGVTLILSFLLFTSIIVIVIQISGGTSARASESRRSTAPATRLLVYPSSPP